MNGKTEQSEKIEDIVLRHSGRGMDILRKDMQDDYAAKAAKMILSWDKGNVFLTTGFYVEGYAETDGPPGTAFLALALKKLGFNPIIITDKFAENFFNLDGIQTITMPFDEAEAWCRNLLAKYQPVGLISVERCGKNDEDKYANMRGVCINEYTAKIDDLFEIAYGHIPTIGVGDGGNEIGMGNEASVIHDKLSLSPCMVKVSQLVIATVSNWGAYAIVAYLQKFSGQTVYMNFDDVYNYISQIVDEGSVDGVLKQHIIGVDGFDMTVEREIIEALEAAI